VCPLQGLAPKAANAQPYLPKVRLAENCAFSLDLGDLHNCGCIAFFARERQKARAKEKWRFFRVPIV
jgi:hypothetical protein